MASKEEARRLYESDLASGYSREQARERLAHFAETGIALPDPTEKYWSALVHQESRGKQSAVSPKGATGVAQVMPATGPEAAALAGLEWDPVAFKEDPVYNAKLGRAYFRKQMQDNDNDPVKALAAYNAGPGAVRRAGGDLSKLPAETQNYVPTIMNRADNAMQPDLDSPEQVAAAQEALMSPKDKARKIYEEVIANGGTREEAKAAIAQFLPPKAAPTAQSAQPVAPSMQPSQPAPAPNDPMVMKIPDPVARQEELLSGGPMDRISAGLERSIGGADRGFRKIIGQLMGNDEIVSKSETQEQGIRDVYKRLDPTGSGPSLADAGRLVGDMGQAALLTKALPAGEGFAGNIAAGAGAGGLQGLLQPTTASDSQMLNAGLGAGLGGTVAGMGSALRGLVGTPDPTRAAAAGALRQQGVEVPVGQEYNSPIGAALRKMGGEKGSNPIPEKSLTKTLAKQLGIEGEDLTNSSLEANLRRSGKAIGDLYTGAKARPDKEFARRIIDIGGEYHMSGPVSNNDPVIKMADHLLSRSAGGRSLSGEEYQALRTGLSANSITGSAAEKQAMGGMKRALDEMFSKQNPRPEAAGLRSEYRLSKILRSGAGIPSEGMTAKQLRNRIEGAANKGEVSAATRSLLDQTNQLLPRARIGGDAAAGAGEDVSIRGLERPGVVSALMAAMRGVAGPASRGYDSGIPQKAVNDPATRSILSILLRGGAIPQAARLEQGEQ